MTNSFNRSFNKLQDIEGVESDHPDDPGGHTMYGISEPLAEEYGYDPEEITEEIAKEILHSEFWESNILDKVTARYEKVAYQIFEFAVHGSSEGSVKSFQRCLNAFNRGEDDYGDISVDGIMGENTISAWRSYHDFRGKKGGEIMYRALDSIQGSYYVRLSESDDRFESFIYGWFNKRIT